MSSIHHVQRDDGIVVLTIDQPDSKANVLSPQLWADLAEILAKAEQMPGLSGLVLTSAKPGIFIAGADLKIIRAATAPNDPAVRQLIEQGLRVLETLEQFPVPTAAIIDGAALGGGLEVALACDYRLVGNHPKCRLGLPETNLGLIPGWGGTQRLPRLIGLPAAAQMLATGQPIDAQQARDLNLAEPSHDGDLIQKAAELMFAEGDFWESRHRRWQPIDQAERDRYRPAIADRPMAVRIALLVMMEGAALPLGDAIDMETRNFLSIAGSEESRPLVEAFFTRAAK